MKTLVKVVWYLDAALFGCVGWLVFCVCGVAYMLMDGVAMQRDDWLFFGLCGFVAAFVLICVWLVHRYQWIRMLRILGRYYGASVAESYDDNYSTLAWFSVIMVLETVAMSPSWVNTPEELEQLRYAVCMTLLWAGVIGIFVKSLGAMLVKWLLRTEAD